MNRLIVTTIVALVTVAIASAQQQLTDTQIQALVEVLGKSESSDTAEYQLLSIYGKRVTPFLIRALDSESNTLRAGRIAQLMAEIRDPRAIDSIFRFISRKRGQDGGMEFYISSFDEVGITECKERIEDPDKYVRRAVFKCLTDSLGTGGEHPSGGKKDPTIFRRHLSDSEFSVRAYCATALGVLRDRLSVPRLISSLGNDQSPWVRQNSATSLGLIGDRHALKPLIEALFDKNESVAWMGAVFALRRLVERSDVKTLLPLLARGTDQQKSFVANVLGYVGDTRAVPQLRDASKSTHERLHLAAENAMRRILEASRKSGQPGRQAQFG